jgi:biofilm protein TabA
MIAGQLADLERYVPLFPGLDKALAWLKAQADAPPANGRYEIDGDRVFALVVTYRTLPREEKILEGHRKYLDVQYLAWGGPEALYYAPSARASVIEEYDEAKDFVKFDTRVAESVVVLSPGEFAVFLPEDAHLPGAMHGQPADVKKIIVKVRLS